MAEIRVEEKRGQGAKWLWLLILLLVVIAAIWFFSSSRMRDADTTGTGATPMDSVHYTPSGASGPPPSRAA